MRCRSAGPRRNTGLDSERAASWINLVTREFFASGPRSSNLESVLARITKVCRGQFCLRLG